MANKIIDTCRLKVAFTFKKKALHLFHCTVFSCVAPAFIFSPKIRFKFTPDVKYEVSISTNRFFFLK